MRNVEMNKILKAVVLLFVVTMFSCIEDPEDTCSSDNICDPDEVEQIVTICEDADGNQTYMVGGFTYATLAEANAAITCTATSEANIMDRLEMLSNRVRGNSF